MLTTRGTLDQLRQRTPAARTHSARHDDNALVETVRRALGTSPPIPITWRDGAARDSRGEPPTLLVTRAALRQLLWSPGELGLARAWVRGELDVNGDLYALLSTARDAAVDIVHTGLLERIKLAGRIIASVAALGGLGLPPRPPAEEAAVHGRRHRRARDASAVRHHYEVGNEFYRLVLGEVLSYSSAYWSGLLEPGEPGESDRSAARQSTSASWLRARLAAAQQAKHDLVLTKLGVGPDSRLLDVGCGWGALVLRAAERGARAVGITLSPSQATYARQAAERAGVRDRVDIRVQDYRDISDGPFDVIASIGMAEHVGAANLRRYASALYGLLRPGGRLLHSAIARRPFSGRYKLDPFIQRYVFPDGELQPLSVPVGVFEDAGLEVRDVQSLREHYALTLRAWVANLEASWEKAVTLVGAGKARVWRLYMAASALQFETGAIGVNQTLAVRRTRNGDSGLPLGVQRPA